MSGYTVLLPLPTLVVCERLGVDDFFDPNFMRDPVNPIGPHRWSCPEHPEIAPEEFTGRHEEFIPRLSELSLELHADDPAAPVICPYVMSDECAAALYRLLHKMQAAGLPLPYEYRDRPLPIPTDDGRFIYPKEERTP